MQRRLIVFRMTGALALIVVLLLSVRGFAPDHGNASIFRSTPVAPGHPGTLARYSPALLGALNTATAADVPGYTPHNAADGDLTATNAAGHFTATFAPSGVRVAPEHGAAWTLHLAVVGNDDAVAQTAPIISDGRIEYRRGPLTEWYINGPVGLEQGFTLTAPLTGNAGADLTLTLALDGPVPPTVTDGTVRLGTSDGGLRYGALAAWDAAGHGLPVHLALGERDTTARLTVSTAGAVFPITVDPFVQHGSAITASDGAANDSFGYSVAVSGDGTTVVIGSPNHANRTGKVYVFTRTAGGYTPVAPTGLKLTGNAPDDRFGISVATNADGSVIAVGANGTSGGTGTVYAFSAATSATQALAAAGAGVAGNRFGESVALSADGLVLLAGAPGVGTGGHLGAGAAGGFTRAATNVAFGAGVTITAADAADGDNFGNSVALNSDGTHAVIGAYGKNQGANNAAGAAYIVARSGGTWGVQTPDLTANGGQANDQFGISVAINADASLIAVGAFGANNFTGAVYMFTGNGSSYTVTQTLTAPSGQPDDRFGVSVALGGTGASATTLVGADGVNSFTGAAYVFRQAAGGSMLQAADTITASDGVGSDRFGAALALSGAGSSVRPVIGAVERSAGAYTGAAYGFDFAPTATTLVFSGIPTTPQAAGTVVSVTVRVTDQFGDTIPNYTGTITLSSDGSAIAAMPHTYQASDMGSFTFSVTLQRAGMHAITATDNSATPLTTTSAAITITATGATSTPNPQPTTHPAAATVNGGVTPLPQPARGPDAGAATQTPLPQPGQH